MVLLTFFLLALNVGISWWNCRVCGLGWEPARREGGLPLVLCWCGVVQSAVGFSMPFLLAESLLVAHYGYPKAAHAMTQLWYVAVIMPVLGTGIVITLNSCVEAYRRRDLASVGAAVYNVGAMASNTYDAATHLGPAFSELGDFFSSDDDDEGGPVILLAVIVGVVIALGAGCLVTYALVRYYRRRAPRLMSAYAS